MNSFQGCLRGSFRTSSPNGFSLWYGAGSMRTKRASTLWRGGQPGRASALRKAAWPMSRLGGSAECFHAKRFFFSSFFLNASEKGLGGGRERGKE